MNRWRIQDFMTVPLGRMDQGATNFFWGVNTAPAALTRGMPVRIQTADGTIKRMRALGTEASVRNVGGLVLSDTVAIGALGIVQTSGYFYATTAQWDAITGQTGGLTPGALYYLSGEFGLLALAPPDPMVYTDPWKVPMGTAISATEFILRIAGPEFINTPAGVTDHGALTGLADDDHAQYHNDARGDARYSLLGHTHAGGAVLSVLATVTVPNSRIEHTETVAFAGCTTLNRLFASIAPHIDSDENDAELLDLIAMSAAPGTGTATITMSFREPTAGPIKLNLMAV